MGDLGHQPHARAAVQGVSQRTVANDHQRAAAESVKRVAPPDDVLALDETADVEKEG